jgi:DUF1680 family protein
MVAPFSTRPIPDLLSPAKPQNVQLGGLLGRRMRKTVENRLLRVAGHPLLMAGFVEKNLPYPWKPEVGFKDSSWEGDISFAWQGEHIGKWIHASVILALCLGNEQLLEMVRSKADELVSLQEEDGYLGTYDVTSRMTAPDGPHTPFSWDVWTHRYHLYGLLTAYRCLGDERWLAAARRIGDLLFATFGPGKKNVALRGTRRGLSSLTVLQSLLMLHQDTAEERYLALASHIAYVSSEERTRVLSKLLDGSPVTTIGDGKAYQLMAVFLGLLDLYRANGDRDLLQAVITGWQQIHENHLHITGGPWTKKTNLIANPECFADPRHWSPQERVENCATVTWIQLNLSLLRLTGEAIYADEAEKALYNHLLGSTASHCGGSAYFSAPNEEGRSHSAKLHCCNSSGPRALARFGIHAYTRRGAGFASVFYCPGRFQGELPDGSSVVIEQSTDYPFGGIIELRLGMEGPKSFPLTLRIPPWSEGATLRVNGKAGEEHLQAGSWAEVLREWRDGDLIELRLPVNTRVTFKTLRTRRVAAFSRGPLVLAAAGVRSKEPRSMPSLTSGISSFICPEPERPEVPEWGSEPAPETVWQAEAEGELPGPAFAIPLAEGRDPEGNRLDRAILYPYCQAGGQEGSVATWFFTGDMKL